jgi:tetratricopeptide (TPR) repeat protein
VSRFDHLEIGNNEPEWSDGGPDEAAVIDQYYYIDKAKTAFYDEDYERALSYYSRALQYDIAMEDAWLGQLRCLIELQELQEAIIWSNRALDRFANSAQILAARGVAESRLGRGAAAIGYVDGAMASQGCTAYVWAARGEVLIPVNARNAEACFAKAVELAPDDWTVRYCIGKAYAIRGCHHQAVDYFRKALRIEQNRFTCWYCLGRCYEALGEFEEAKRSYGRSLACKPGFSKARNGIRRLENKGLISRLGASFRRLFNSKSQVNEG